MDKKMPKKSRAKTYEKKLKVNATFDEVIDLALGKPLKKSEETAKKSK